MKALDLNLLANRLRARRLELGLSQETLAERAQINQSTVSLLERGEQIPTLNSILLLTQSLDISIDWLIGTTDNMQYTADGIELDELEKEAVQIIRDVDRRYRSQLVHIMKMIVEFRHFNS